MSALCASTDQQMNCMPCTCWFLQKMSTDPTQQGRHKGKLTACTSCDEPQDLCSRAHRKVLEKTTPFNINLMKSQVLYRADPRALTIAATGLLVIAKDEYSLVHLSDQFRARSVQRTYQSITLGCPSPAAGQVSTNIGRDSADRKKMAAFPLGSSRYALPPCLSVSSSCCACSFC